MFILPAVSALAYSSIVSFSKMCEFCVSPPSFMCSFHDYDVGISLLLIVFPCIMLVL